MQGASHPSSLDPTPVPPHTAHSGQAPHPANPDVFDASQLPALDIALPSDVSSVSEGQGSSSTTFSLPGSFPSTNLGPAAGSQPSMLPQILPEHFSLPAFPPAPSTVESPCAVGAGHDTGPHLAAQNQLSDQAGAALGRSLDAFQPSLFTVQHAMGLAAPGLLADPVGSVPPFNDSLTALPSPPPPATPTTLSGAPTSGERATLSGAPASGERATGPVLPDAAPRGSPGWAEWGMQTLRKVKQTIAGQLAGPPSSIDKV